jgi:aspartate/methionine/tyrosine aminotransferase
VTTVGSLSRRGEAFADRSPLSGYMQASRDHADRRWSPARPDGFVDLSTAENKLMWDLLEEPLGAARAVPPRAVGYDDIRGSASLREAVADFTSRRFLGVPFQPDEICTLAGAGAVLEALFYSLCDPGDGVLLATPGYPGFWMDLENRDEVTVVPVPTDWDDGFRIRRTALDAAFDDASRPIRALLLASPANPTGQLLDEAELVELVGWCRERRIHLVADEVYALSVFDGSPFTSVTHVADPRDDVHVVWALSKDFAVSGLRCGFLMTRNELLGRSVAAQGIWSGVSGRTQHLWAELLADESWTDVYVAMMRERLADAHRLVTDVLTRAEIRHLPGRAGFFLMIDLSAFLDEPTFRAEQRLWSRMVELGVNLTPGEALRAPTPGWFRLCFAATPVESLELGVERISAAVS